MENRIMKLEEKVNDIEKEIVGLSVRAEERHKVVHQKLDEIKGSLDKHIELHLRREDAVLAKAQGDEVQARQQATQAEIQAATAPIMEMKSTREKLFYPVVVLLSGIVVTLAIKALG